LQANHYTPPSGHPLRPFIRGIWQIRVVLTALLAELAALTRVAQITVR
jgi:hypothetical protein